MSRSVSSFVSFVAWPRLSRAQALLEELDELHDEVIGPIVDARGDKLFCFEGDAAPLSVTRCARRMKGFPPSPFALEHAFVNGTPKTVNPAPGRTVFAHAPALSVIDRVLAIPNGVELMRGRGLVRLAPQRRERVGLAFAALLQRLGGRNAVVETLAPYFAIAGDDGHEPALLALKALARGFSAAKEKNRGLILLDCISR